MNETLFYVSVVILATVIGFLAIRLWHKYGDSRKMTEFYAILLVLLAAAVIFFAAKL